MKTLFITGATGFVGSHTARRFLQDGWHVKALVRRPDKPGLLPEGVEIITGELSDEAGYTPALKGCDTVLHIAGLVKARTRGEYLAANALGAESIARAAARACPQAFFLLVSSQAAAGPSNTGLPLRESAIATPVSWYGQSKLEGERLVERQVRGPWAAIRPCVVYGAGDPGLLELFKAIERGIAPIPAGGRMRVQLIAVKDLAEILRRMAQRTDLSGRRLFAANDVVPIGELIMSIAAMRATPPIKLRAPAAAIRLLGLLESGVQAVTRTARPFNYDKAREMLQPDWICDGTTLLREVGLSDVTAWQEGFRALCRCYVAASWLRRDIWVV